MAAQAQDGPATGYVVSGFVEGAAADATTRVIAVLARSEADAIAAAIHSVPGFEPAGIMSEAELESHLELIRRLRTGAG